MLDDLDGLQKKLESSYKFLTETVMKFNTFDFLSYIAYYNSLHDIHEYSDNRDDKHFFISEVLAQLCLKSDFKNESMITYDDFLELIPKIQKETLNYCIYQDFLSPEKNKVENRIEEIVNTLVREAKVIRNPGIPDHHYEFMSELFEPIGHQIVNKFGFSIEESISIRKFMPLMLNNKCEVALQEADKMGKNLVKEIANFKRTGSLSLNTTFKKEVAENLSKLPHKKIREIIITNARCNVFFNFGEVYTFDSKELSDYTGISLSKIEKFLTLFSCEFPALTEKDEIYTPDSILRSTPILHNKGKYLIPSLPLFLWSTEFVIEESLKGASIFNRYKDIKHDFLLNKGIEFLSNIFGMDCIVGKNLFYKYKGDEFETDCIIQYDKTLIIIEAKGNRFTPKARSGHRLKTEDHLKDIVRDSYKQAHRTLSFINSKKRTSFYNKKKQYFYIDRESFNDVFIITLSIEGIGNIAMNLKANDQLGYFNKEHFPWIVSLYDLVIINDLISNPIILINYLKKRYSFLSNPNQHTYEELDLLTYYFKNRLFIEDYSQENEFTYLFPDTDEINDYYMYKFGPKTIYTKKPSLELSEKAILFLEKLESSGISGRSICGNSFLNLDKKSIDIFLKNISKIKRSGRKDKKNHDCSIFTHDFGGVGITYVVGSEKMEIENTLNKYCSYKLSQLAASKWIGIGDISYKDSDFSFVTIKFY